MIGWEWAAGSIRINAIDCEVTRLAILSSVYIQEVAYRDKVLMSDPLPVFQAGVANTPNGNDIPMARKQRYLASLEPLDPAIIGNEE